MDLLFPLEGFRFFAGFVTAAEERQLLALLETLDWQEVRMHGVAARRQVVQFGLRYGFETSRLAEAPPLPPPIQLLRDRCAGLAGVSAGAFEEGLVTRYPPGAGIGWHRDAPSFGPVVVGVSLVGVCTMRFRPAVPSDLQARRTGSAPAPASPSGGKASPLRPPARRSLAVPLPPRSAYVLAGPARSRWEHGIPPVKALRYSVTFRMVRRSDAVA